MADDVFIDAGVFIGALLMGDPRHTEALDIVNRARVGDLHGATTVGVLCEVYAALTWEQAQPRHSQEVAASAVLALIESPSQIRMLPETDQVLHRTLQLAMRNKLNARRIHDARHAGTALCHCISRVMTYDINDWKYFERDGLEIVGPASVLSTTNQG